MRIIIITLVLLSQNLLAQITPNPKVERKSTTDTFINKIEITDEYTVVSMQYVGKSRQETLKEYLNDNEELKEQLSQMNPMMRNMYLKQMMEGVGGSTISIQPSSMLKAENGKNFEFIKASNIPVAPERLEVEPDKKYFFKVYFEKLEPGIQKVDLVEGPNDERDGFQYWNFYGVAVNNPAVGEDPVNASATEMTMSGKVFDAATNKTIQAKIVCKLEGDDLAFDSVQTSRTGYFEFLMKPDSYVYSISAEGYVTSEEQLDLSKLTKSFERDIYLEPIEMEVEEKEDSITEVEEIPSEMEKVDENTFRLNHVYFPTGKAEILDDSHEELDKVIEMMNEKPEMKIRVDGHTDNQGDSRLNMILSLDRAKNVKDYLVAGGIETDRISFKGWGDTKPIVTNATNDSRQKNRRVEIVILEE